MKGKILAIDYGTKRVGIASGDLEHKIAFPREILENRGMDFVVNEVLKLWEELSVAKVIIGWPLSMREDQKENPVMKDIERLASLLREKAVEVELFDERLSSFEASEMTGKIPRKGEKVDAHAAQVILQRWFDNNIY